MPDTRLDALAQDYPWVDPPESETSCWSAVQLQAYFDSDGQVLPHLQSAGPMDPNEALPAFLAKTGEPSVLAVRTVCLALHSSCLSLSPSASHTGCLALPASCLPAALTVCCSLLVSRSACLCHCSSSSLAALS